jgi:tRNA(fMet)-specific endonuclease VapC
MKTKLQSHRSSGTSCDTGPNDFLRRARERARLVAQGATPPFTDGQIAAIAHVNELTLVTFNDTDFRQFQGLRVLSWR